MVLADGCRLKLIIIFMKDSLDSENLMGMAGTFGKGVIIILVCGKMSA